MGLIGDHHHIGPVAKELGNAEFLDQGEHIAVVATQQFGQLGATAGMALVTLGLGHHPSGLEGVGNLIVEVGAIGDDHEGPIAGNLALDLLAVEAHRIALAAALGLPEHPRPAVAPAPGFQSGGDGVVDAEHLVILGDDLDQTALAVSEQGEILDVIEQALRLTGATQQHFQRYPPGFVFTGDSLPLEEPLPVGAERANATGVAIGGDQEGIAPEQLRDGGLVVGEIVIEGNAGRYSGLLELDHHQRQAVDESHQIGPAVVEIPLYFELGYGEPVVLHGPIPIDYPQPHLALAAPLEVGHRHQHPVLEQAIDLPVRRHRAHGRAVAAEFLDGGVDCFCRLAWIKTHQGGP